jgi:hypothetical protein
MQAQDIVLYGFPLSVLVIGIIAVARYAGMPSIYAPPVALVLGILGGEASQAHMLQTGGTPDWIFGAISGIALGVLSSGLYSHAQVYITAAIAAAEPVVPTPVPDPAPTPPVVVPLNPPAA